jgi:hypothetical protein
VHPDLAAWLHKEPEIKALGVDTASVDYGQSKDFKTHQLLYAENIIGLKTWLRWISFLQKGPSLLHYQNENKSRHWRATEDYCLAAWQCHRLINIHKKNQISCSRKTQLFSANCDAQVKIYPPPVENNLSIIAPSQ